MRFDLAPRRLQLTDDELIEVPACLEQDLPNMTDETYHQNPR